MIRRPRKTGSGPLTDDKRYRGWPSLLVKAATTPASRKCSYVATVHGLADSRGPREVWFKKAEWAGAGWVRLCEASDLPDTEVQVRLINSIHVVVLR